MAPRDAVVIGRAGLDELIGVLRGRGYRTRGPVVRDGAVVPGDVTDCSDLPAGWHDSQEPGRYELRRGQDDALFGWAVGPQSWKADFLPSRSVVWRARASEGSVVLEEEPDRGARVAVIGARPCDLAALGVLTRVLAGGVPDPVYRRRRAAAFVVAVECGTPAGTCFCASMGSGPGADAGFDLCLTELDGGCGHRFLVRVGTEAGAAVLDEVEASQAALAADWSERAALLARSEASMGCRLDTAGLAGLLARNQEHPRWTDVAGRCLACGNCTLVCPTCFCTSVEDTTDVRGDVLRSRRWASCFELDHSLLHGGPVRATTRSRYRQWLTHKLSTWFDQFGTSGCVGCGRCITWCPVGIDLTVEAAAIRAADGASVPAGPEPVGGLPGAGARW